MSRPHSTRYTVAALLLLGIAVVILVSLGQWQLRRSDERRAILAAIEAGRKQAPLVLTPATPPADMTAWRVAQASGTWLPEFSVLLDNRNQDGRPGYWLATPLLLDASARRAVLVLRGWLPRVIQGQGEPDLPAAPKGVQIVQGELSERVPRLFELWSLGGSQTSTLPATLPAADGKVPQVQNLPLDAYARATGLDLLPTVLSQGGPGDDGLVRDWPQPSVDFQQNTSYAVQWFAFGAIAAIAWLVVLGGAIRRMRQRGDTRAQARIRARR
ncbi:SURF1 family protein [Achromobacter sp. NFACC18-2]|uniref:SURF1 family protein n=1 Tax=Achromobacter sp. NFACC18-2 TaxID=1564112 RepID=UPI0008C7DE4B|nr:SURF1 family protein [Achromobacter sp. NFACC18-2]SEI62245.1 Cytochrome oxidase assembly protein ShyY1 [Achromobacter sp. NFACC18-2]